MARTWTASDPRWAALTPYQRAAAMALMEANDGGGARNALGAMINRAKKEGADLGEHVSGAVYQPTIEPTQQARLERILQSPAYADLTGWAERRYGGQEADPVNGATHFLAPEATMLALERQNPGKYKNWGPRGANWTGYDPSTGQYQGVVMRDGSHAFLAPGGAYGAPGEAPKVNAAQNGAISGGQTPAAPAQITAPQLIRQIFAEAPDLNPTASPFNNALSGLGASRDEDDAELPEAQQPRLAALPPALPTQRRPLDLNRLRQVLASRARLGSEGIT